MEPTHSTDKRCIVKSAPAADARRMEGTQTPLSGTETALIGLVVFMLLVPRATWELVQHFEVMAHEGMHGVVGSLSGRTVEWIELKSNGDGGTRVVPTTGPGYLVAAFVGYLGPSAFGLAAARLIQFGHIIAVLWVSMLLLALLLIRLKPSFGYLTVPLAGFLIFLILKHMSQTVEILAAYVITWFLLLSGVRIVVEHGANADDAGLLRDRTSIPRLVWFALWLAGTLAAVVIGARWLLHPMIHPPAS
jgi:Peptidase M50B-like